MSAEVSHGRGGAGNIATDETKYVDGEVVREGVAGSHHDGAFSTGRGGEFLCPSYCTGFAAGAVRAVVAEESPAPPAERTLPSIAKSSPY